jgi:hypothetical protein
MIETSRLVIKVAAKAAKSDIRYPCGAERPELPADRGLKSRQEVTRKTLQLPPLLSPA